MAIVENRKESRLGTAAWLFPLYLLLICLFVVPIAVAGIIEDGETPEDVARREAEEEAGCAIGDLVAGPSFYASPGISTEHVRVFVGRTDVQGIGGIHGLASEGEDIRVAVHPLDEALAMLNDGRIVFAPAAVALQWLALNRDEIVARWQ